MPERENVITVEGIWFFYDDFLFYGAKIHYRENFEKDKFDVDILT